MTTPSLNLRVDKRNLTVVNRSGQSAGVRINTIIDRYAFMVDALRSRVFSLVGEHELSELTVTLRQIAAQRSSAEQLKGLWLALLPIDSDARAVVLNLDPVEVIALAEAIEGRQVNLSSQS